MTSRWIEDSVPDAEELRMLFKREKLYCSEKVLLPGLLAAFFLMSVSFLNRFPRVWVDESWGSIVGYQLASEGRINNPILEGREGQETHFLQPRITQSILLSISYKLLGFGLIQSRLVSIFVGLLVLIFTYYLAKRFYDEKIAIIGSIFLIIDNLFFVSARTIRPDIIVAAVALISIHLFLIGIEKNSKSFFALSGLISGIGLYSHPNAFLGLASVLILFIYEYKLKFIRKPGFWLFGLFVFVGLLPYVIYVFVQDYQNHFADFWAQVGHGAKPIVGSGFLVQTFKDEIRRYSMYVFFPKRFFIFLVDGLAITFAFKRRRKMDKIILIVIFTHLILFPLLIVTRSARYLTVLMPFFSILIAKMLLDLVGVAPFSRRRLFQNIREFEKRTVFASIVFLGFFLNQFGGAVYILWKHRDYDYYGFITNLERYIPEGARVWGSMSFWIGLYEHPYRTQFTYGHDVETFKPEYVVLYDSDTWGGVAGTTGRSTKSSAWFRSVAPLRGKMESLCQQKGTFVGKVDDKFHGNVEIYHINW